MAIKLQSLKRHEQWFDVPGDNGAMVLVREADPGETQEYLGAMAAFGTIVDLPEQRKFINLLRCDSIADWTGIEDGEGNPAPASPGNKLLFLRQGGMEAFIRECMEKVKEEGEKLRKDAEKN